MAKEQKLPAVHTYFEPPSIAPYVTNGKSKTDPSMDTPIEMLVKRFLCGELKPQDAGGFDVEDDPKQALADSAIPEQGSEDWTDVQASLERVNAIRKDLLARLRKKKQAEKPAPTPDPSPAPEKPKE